MRTLVISDLHLGLRSGAEVLARPAALDVLLERLADVDRLVLLGDTLELRHGPTRDALATAEPVLRAIGDALGPSREVVLVPGNHDHAIARRLAGLARAPPGARAARRSTSASPPSAASWIAKRLASFLAPGRRRGRLPRPVAARRRLRDARPLPRRPPRSSRRSSASPPGAMARMVGAIPDPATPDDYESVLAPIYALSQASAQRGAPGRVDDRQPLGGRRVARAQRPRARAAGCAAARSRSPFRLGVLAANRAGVGPVEPSVGVDGPAPRRPGRDRPRRRAGCGSRRRTSSSATRTAPAGCASDAAVGVAHAGRHAAAQRRQLDLRPAVHGPRPAGVEPVLAGRRDRRRRRRPAAPGAPARRRPGAGAAGCTVEPGYGPQHAGRELHGVAGHAVADLELEHAGAVALVLDERVAAGVRRRRSRGRWRAPRRLGAGAGSSTAQTAPAS